MYVRCPQCLSATWSDSLRPAGPDATFLCGECGQRHELDPTPELGETLRDHYHATVRLSQETALDMPTAYSVLLGILVLNPSQPRRARAGKRASRPAEAPRQPVAPLLADLDPGWREAIAQGHLTLQDALGRGERDVFASKLERRHDLPQELAYAVADNRISLREAMRQLEQTRARRKEEANRRRTRRIYGALGTTLAALAVGAVSWHFGTRDAGQRTPVFASEERGPRAWAAAIPAADRGRTLRAATRVARDDQDRPVEIEGPNPLTVLIEYCDAVPGGLGLEPIEITSTVPAFESARLGLFRDLESLESVRAIRIRRDHRSGRWVAGDGKHVIQPGPVPPLPPDALRIPVARDSGSEEF